MEQLKSIHPGDVLQEIFLMRTTGGTPCVGSPDNGMRKILDRKDSIGIRIRRQF